MTSNQPTSNICSHSMQVTIHLVSHGQGGSLMVLFQLCIVMPLRLVRQLATCTRRRRINPDRVTRFGLSQSTVDIWVDFLCVSDICEVSVTKLDQIWSKYSTNFEAKPGIVNPHRNYLIHISHKFRN